MVGALPDPRLTWSEALAPVETRVGPQQRILGLSQQIPWFGTLGLRRGVQSRRAAAADARVEAVALDVVRDVRAAYAELAYLRQATDVTGAHLDLLAQWEAVARTRYEAGTGRYADVIKAQVELGMLEDRLAGLRDRRRPLEARLNAALGREDTAPLHVVDLVPDETPADADALRARLLAANPDLAVAAHQAAGERLTVDLAGKRRYPDLTLGVNWMQIGPARMDGVADSGKDAVFATVGVSLPLWQGSYGAARKEAEGRTRAAEERRSDLARRLTAQLEQSVYDHRDARRRVQLYRDTLLPKGRQALEAVRTAYEVGSASFLDLVDAERALLEFELTARRAAADLVVSRADIDRLVGPAGAPAQKEE